MQTSDMQLQQRLNHLQEVAEQLQTSITKHSLLTSPGASLDPHAVLKYAHKIAYTSFAPLGHDPSQPLPPNFRPPNPQEWQLRASQLHQFQAECNQKKAQAAASTAPTQSPTASSTVQLPPGLKLPPMPRGWKPGMPIPGLDELLSAGAMEVQAATPPATVSSQAAFQNQESFRPQAAPVQSSAATEPAPAVHSNEPPPAEAGVQSEPALRPAPFVPDFVLNPTLEAVEEEYSSSDYSDEDI